MAKEFCNYHPAKPSVWRCQSCRIPFCTDCVPGSRENYNGDTPRCTLCNTALTWLGGANMAEPFWTQAGSFFRYPFKVTGLMALGLIVLVSALLPANLIGLVGLLFLTAFTIHYGLRIIDDVRSGDMEPPTLSEVFARQGEHLFLKQVAVILLLGVFVFGATRLGAAAGVLVGLFVLVALPASTMLLAMTSSVTEAVNPKQLAVLMLRIGPAYLLLWICLMAVAAGPTLITPTLMELVPERAALPVSMLVSSYFTFVTYAMMGYILYEKQAELGFASDDEFGEHLDYKPFTVRRALAQARILAAANRQEQALEALRTGVNVDESNAELRELYYRIVVTTGDEEAIRRNANSICEFFVARGLPVKAAHYCLETRKRHADFAPADSVTCHRIAEQFFEQGRHRDAAALLMKLHRNAPQYPDMVNALVLMARIFFEGLNERDKALALLRQVKARHPDHAEMPRIDRLLEVMSYNGSVAV